jgi:hypothetical protein
MLVKYLHTQLPSPTAVLIRAILGAGFAARYVLYRLRSNAARAAELRSYARTLLSRPARNAGTGSPRPELDATRDDR